MATLKKQCMLTLVITVAFSMSLYIFMGSKFQIGRILHSSKDFILNNPGCKIMKLDLLDPTVNYLIKRLPDMQCDEPPFIMLEKNNTLRMNKAVVPDDVSCFVQTILRKNDNHNDLRGAVPMDNGRIRVESEFVKVECVPATRDEVLYTQFYPFVFPKENVEKRILNYKQKKYLPQSEKFRIIMLGLDSVSKNHFLRHMLRTFDFMKRNLTFAEIAGYNKIGKNTYANIVPMLTGKLEYEVPRYRTANELPLIWNKYMDNGYRTQFSEDFPQGSIFNYGRNGFEEEPADYYLRPWSLAVEPHIPKWRTGCLNERIETNVILKYMEDFLDLFPDDPLFSFTFLTRLSHDDVNGLSYLDKPVHDFLERLYLKGYFNNTILFFFSDHGFRYGEMRSTYVGRMEGRLPFMFIVVPPSFPTKYPQMYQNLQTNQRRLVTPLDIHATLHDLLFFNGTGSEVKGPGRSISLFKHEIPANRTCEDAFIKNQWCACVVSETVSVNDNRVQKYASAILKKINFHTRLHRTKCAQLSLVKVLGANKEDVMLGESSPHDGFSNYLITIQVSPSDGIFEGSVWYNGESSYTVDNTIERINLYGNQSACVEENILKPFCFCIAEVN